jgi:hypothetical protein
MVGQLVVLCNGWSVGGWSVGGWSVGRLVSSGGIVISYRIITNFKCRTVFDNAISSALMFLL